MCFKMGTKMSFTIVDALRRQFLSLKMVDHKKGDVSSAEAVLYGALAPGVNGPTWNTLKVAFLLLGMSLVLMLSLAFSSSDSWLTLHVTFLVLITVTLFLLLSWYLGQTGLVSVEHQMQELDLVPRESKDALKIQ